MRLPLFIVACLLTAGLAWRWRCGWTHETRTKRDPATGMRRCTHRGCGRAYASMSESGELDGSGHVPLKRRTFQRKHGIVTQEYPQ